MNAIHRFVLTKFAVALTLLAPVFEEPGKIDSPKNGTSPPDASKSFIEQPLKSVITTNSDEDRTTSSAVIDAIDRLHSGQEFDVTKRRIERPTEIGLEPKSKSLPARLDQKVDITKRKIELSTEIALAAKTDALVKTLERVRNTKPNDHSIGSESNGIQNTENPSVRPGLVDWHSDFETACAASRSSGRPVLLFHLLGQLDQRFT